MAYTLSFMCEEASVSLDEIVQSTGWFAEDEISFFNCSLSLIPLWCPSGRHKGSCSQDQCTVKLQPINHRGLQVR